MSLVTVSFIGKSDEINEKLSDCYGKLKDDKKFVNDIHFDSVIKDNIPEISFDDNEGLFFYELTENHFEDELKNIHILRESRPNWQGILLVDANIDYYEIAKQFQIGNILKKSLFDFSIIRALTFRLSTKTIFGFSPYFPNGYTLGPLDKIVHGQWTISDLMHFFEENFLNVIQDEKSHHRIRTYFYELLINTIAYSVVGITAEDRDSGQISVPSDIYIPSEKPFKISMVKDEEKYGFSFFDNSGTLTLSRILDKFRRHSKIGNEEFPPGIMDVTGRGLSLVHKDNRLIINILKNAITEIIFLHYHDQDLNKYESIIVTEVNAK